MLLKTMPCSRFYPWKKHQDLRHEVAESMAYRHPARPQRSPMAGIRWPVFNLTVGIGAILHESRAVVWVVKRRLNEFRKDRAGILRSKWTPGRNSTSAPSYCTEWTLCWDWKSTHCAVSGCRISLSPFGVFKAFPALWVRETGYSTAPLKVGL